MNNILERNETGTAAGNFSRIERVTWQPAHVNSWQLPAIEQSLQSIARGGVVAVAGVTVSVIVGQLAAFWPCVGVSLAVAVGAAFYDFQNNIDALFETYRLQELSRELYERETAARTSATATHASIDIHTEERKPSGRTVHLFDRVLGLDVSQLPALATATLSTRGLQNAGFTFDKSKLILEQLAAQTFIAYSVSNQPAGWTAKGRALMREYQQLA